MKYWISGLVIIGICFVGAFFMFRPQIQDFVGHTVSRHVLPHPQVQRTINESVSKYIISHPQVVEQSVINLQAQREHEEVVKKQKLVRDYGMDLMNDKDGSPILGNPSGSIKMVVFMDPFCVYCRKFHQVLDKAVEENKNLEIIVREIPFLSEKSELVIRAMLAAKMQGKYPELQKLIYKVDPSVNQHEILNLAKTVSIDPQRLEQDMQRPEFKELIERNIQLAKQIHLNGTPTYVINGHIKEGAIGYTQLQQLLYKDQPVVKK